MLHVGTNGTRTKVNALKKVKVDGQWKLCPVIVETGGKLKDRVQVNGHAEVHSEGVYDIEWRENGQRIRQSVPNRHHVIERARLKALELDARKAGIHADGKPDLPSRSVTAMSASSNNDLPSLKINPISKAAGVVLSGVESYLQEIVNASVRSQLAALGIVPNEIAKEPAMLLSAMTDHSSTDVQTQPTDPDPLLSRETGGTGEGNGTLKPRPPSMMVVMVVVVGGGGKKMKSC